MRLRRGKYILGMIITLMIYPVYGRPVRTMFDVSLTLHIFIGIQPATLCYVQQAEIYFFI